MLALVGCNPIQSATNLSTTTAQAMRNNILATKQATQRQSAQETDYYQRTVEAQVSQELITQSKEWPIVFFDTFNTNTSNWPTGAEDGDLSTVTLQVDARYSIKAIAKNNFIYWVRPEIPIVTDFRLEVEAAQLSGADDGQVGLLFRQEDDNNYYIFRITNDQYYSLSRSTSDGWETVIAWTNSPVIQSSKINHLTVIVQDSLFILLINHQVVQEIKDANLVSGQCGLVIGLFTTDDEAVFEFDNFTLRAPNQQTEIP